MPIVDSTATLTEVKTAPPVNGKDLITDCVGPAAQRPDGKNLLIKIEVGADKATFHCVQPEYAGAHKQRHVLFEADKHCWVTFTNETLFTEKFLDLPKGESVPAWIADGKQGETDCVIRVEATKTGKVVTMKAMPAVNHGPVIVVP